VRPCARREVNDAKIKVFMVDDRYRARAARLLSYYNEIEVVGEASDGDRACKLGNWHPMSCSWTLRCQG
jgi:hypothetical protein